eukprot:TRINITY_DN3545_c0_g1_i1.p1 TRINITY_DN3545_c0_g1~~TRINITY_DN3545_c0_g1_i1.p1  ORF type:complete len:201 (-),score=20.67 TRINITY_DN3545_c0_g1_i1:129-731(-)
MLTRSGVCTTNFVKRLASTAEGTTNEVQLYDRSLRWLHWGMAATIIGCVSFVKRAQSEKDMQKKGELMFYHKSFGLASVGLLLPRIFLLYKKGTPGPIPGTNIVERMLGNLSHKAFYVLLCALPITGIQMGYYGGKGLPFFFTTIPGAEKPKPDFAKFAYLNHKRAGQILEILFPIHIGAALVHAARGHRVFRRMNPLIN